MKTQTILSLGVLLSFLAVSTPSPTSAAGPEGPWLDSLEEALETAKAKDQMILVDLFAQWCGWCHRLEEQVFSTPRFLEYTSDKFVLLRVDTEDQGEGTLLQQRFDARRLPTTLILEPEMIKVGAITGFAPLEGFIDRIEDQLQVWNTLESFYPQVRESDDVELIRKLATDLHERGAGTMAAQLWEKLLSQVDAGQDTIAWLHYQAADAHRLGHALEPAREHLEKGRRLVGAEGDLKLREQFDILNFHIAQEDGDCTEATTTLEQFLEQHPKSVHRLFARRTLESIRKGETMECT